MSKLNFNNVNDTRLVKFSCMRPGDVFISGGKFYITLDIPYAIKETVFYNVVCLNDGHICVFSDDELVTPTTKADLNYEV